MRPYHGRASATDLRTIVWTDEAVAHLEAIVAYITAFNPAAAQTLGERLSAVADSLAEFPGRGRDAGGGKREMTTVWPYVLRYRVEVERVIILRIRHGARDEAGRQQNWADRRAADQAARLGNIVRSLLPVITATVSNRCIR